MLNVKILKFYVIILIYIDLRRSGIANKFVFSCFSDRYKVDLLVYNLSASIQVTCSATICWYAFFFMEPGWRNRYSDWLLAGRPSSSPGGVKNFHFSVTFRPALGSTQPPIQ
jgi:hypothetical protein